jgi:hypothetical protein
MSSERSWGDIAGPRVRATGLLFSPDVEAALRSELEQFGPERRQRFALRCARRAMAIHRTLPVPDQRAFTLGWGSVLGRIEAGLDGSDPDARRDVVTALKAFRTGPFNQIDDQDSETDDSAAHAAIYAAECFETGAVQAAVWAASCVADLAFAVADEEAADRGATGDVEEFIRACVHPLVQAELRQQLEDLAEVGR